MEGTIIQTADPRAEYRALREEIDVAIRSVLEGPSYVMGDAVRRFEVEFAGHIGVSHGIGVNNGTDAIHLALRALDIGTGDEVVDRIAYRCGHSSGYLHGGCNPGTF